MSRAVSALRDVGPDANNPTPATTTTVGPARLVVACAATAADTTLSRAGSSAAGSTSTHNGHDPAYTIWSGVSGPASTIERPSGVVASRSPSGEPSNTTAAGAAGAPSRTARTRESRFTSPGSGCDAETTPVDPGNALACASRLRMMPTTRSERS